MTLTKNYLLNFFLNEKLHKFAGIIFTLSLIGVLIVTPLERFTGIVLPLWLEYAIAGPWFVGLVGFLFFGGPILHIMAEHGEYSADSIPVMKWVGSILSVFTGFVIVGEVISLLPHGKEYFWLLFLLRVLAGVIIGLSYHSMVEWLIKKLVL